MTENWTQAALWLGLALIATLGSALLAGDASWLAVQVDEILRASLINIAATILAAVCATGVIRRLQRT